MEKRFVIQTEDFAQKRVEALSVAVESLKKEYPEVISATLFRSLSRGDTKEDSDIDAVLYVDVDYISEKERLEGKSGDDVIDLVVKKKELPNVPGLQFQSLDIYLRPDLYDKYNKLIQDRVLSLDPSLGPDHVEHIRSLPMSESGINKLVDYLVKMRGVSVEQGKEALVVNTPTTLLGSMFHLDIGGGIKKYRKILLNKLNDVGPAGELIWFDIIRYVERWEQKVEEYSDLPTQIHYPRKLKDAVKVYG